MSLKSLFFATMGAALLITTGCALQQLSNTDSGVLPNGQDKPTPTIANVECINAAKDYENAHTDLSTCIAGVYNGRVDTAIKAINCAAGPASTQKDATILMREHCPNTSQCRQALNARLEAEEAWFKCASNESKNEVVACFTIRQVDIATTMTRFIYGCKPAGSNDPFGN
jgi:hypothetical protein